MSMASLILLSGLLGEPNSSEIDPILKVPYSELEATRQRRAAERKAEEKASLRHRAQIQDDMWREYLRDREAKRQALIEYYRPPVLIFPPNPYSFPLYYPYSYYR